MIAIDKQKEFEKEVAKILGFKGHLSQRNFSEQMIIDDFMSNDESDYLSGTIGRKTKRNKEHEVILIATKDSEVNYINCISLNMVKLLLKHYAKDSSKVVFATNIPIDIHSSKARDLKKEFNFHIVNIGHSFCKKHNLKFTEIY